MNAGTLQIEILANLARLQQDMQSANRMVGGAVGDMIKQFGSLEAAINKSQNATLGFAKSLLVGAAAGLGLSAIVGKINSVIESMAKLKTLSEKTGASVENLSKLSFIAKSSGSDIDAVAGAMAKLSKGMVGAEEETKGAGAAMKFLGVSAKDANGNLKDPAVMFTDIAKKLNEYEDGAGKAAIAQALFGKAGADMLPTLKMLAENGDMAAKVTTAQAEAARQYTRDMAKLEAQQQAIFKTVAIALLPVMSDFASVLLDASKNTNTLNGAAKKLAGDNSITDWADAGALGVARLVDVIKIIPALLSAVASSFQVVYQDIKTVFMAQNLINPIAMAKASVEGRNIWKEFGDQLTERNKTLEDANKKYSELWNADGAATEKAMQKRIDARRQEQLFMASANAEDLKLLRQNMAAPEKKKANFANNTSAGGGAAELSEYDKLIKKLDSEVVKAYGEAEAALHGYNKGQAEFIALSRTDVWSKMTGEQRKNIAAKYEQIIVSEQLKETTKREFDAAKAHAEAQAQLRKTEQDGIASYILAQQDGYNAAVKGAQDAAIAAQIEFDQRDMSKSQIAEITLLTMQSTLAKYADGSAGAIATQQQIDAQMRLIGILKMGERRDDLAKTAEDTRNAWAKAGADIQRTLGNAFGKAGEAIGKMASVYGSFMSSQLNAEKKLADLKKSANGDPVKIAKAETEARAESTQAQIGMYGDMAGAAQGFFNEGSAGYKLLGAISQAFHLAEMAFAIQTMITKVTTAETFAGVRTATQMAVDAAVIGGVVTEETATAVSVANAGTQSSAWGITAVVKAIASMPFPFNLVAGAVTLAAVLAVGAKMMGGVGGGGSVNVAKERQEKQGTGTVFGDDTAKSESINNSIKLLQNSDITLAYTNQMLSALNAIRDNIGGLVNVVLRSSGLLGGVKDQEGLGIGSGGNWLFGKNSTELVDQGIAIGIASTKQVAHVVPSHEGEGGETPGYTYYTTEKVRSPQTIGEVRASGTVEGMKYSQTHSESSGFLGLFGSSSDSETFKALEKSVKHQLALTIISIADGVQAAAGALGVSGADFEKKINDFAVNLGEDGLISLKGLSGQALQDALNGVFSKFGDQLAEAVMPGLDDFIKVGEGYMETMIRVASGVEKAKVSLDLLGISAINFKDIVNKQGNVDAEIIRQSVVIHETTGGTVDHGVVTGGTTTGIGKIIQGFNGSGDDMIKLYTTLLDMRQAMIHTGASVADVTQVMITAAGGVSQLQSGINAYYDLFFTEEQKRANTQNDLNASFGALGLSMPTSIDGFKALVNAQDLTTDAGQKMYAKLMLIAPAFGNAANAAAAAAAAVDKAAAESRKATTQTMQEALAPFRPEKTQGQLIGEQSSTLYTMETLTGFSNLNDVMKLTDAQVAGLSDTQRNAITAYANAKKAAEDYNKALHDAQLTYEEAVMKHNGATDLQIAQFQRTNAASAVLGLGIHNIGEATDAAYIASLHLTPAQLALVTAYINTDTAVNSLTGSLNESAQAAQSAFEALQSLASAQIDADISAFQKKMGLISQAIKDASGGDYGKELTSNIDYLKGLKTLEEAKAAAILATSPNGTNYAPYIAAMQNVNLAGQSIAQMTKDYLLYVQLEAQYAGHGKELVDLENWYADQKNLASGNQAALLIIEQAYGIKRNNIINGTLSSGLSQVGDNLRKWLLSLDQNASLSPLTAQQQRDAAYAVYMSDLAKANGGDKTAQAAITKDAEALLAAQKAVSGFAGEYSAIFAMIKQNIGDLANFVDPAGAPAPTVIAPTSFDSTNNAIGQTTEAIKEMAVDLSQQLSDAKIALVEMRKLLEKQNILVKDQTTQVTSSNVAAGDRTTTAIKQSKKIGQTA